MLTEAILQIYVPQGHQILNRKNDTANEFPPTARLCSSPKAINSIEGQMEIHAGKDRVFLFANLDQIRETSFPLGTRPSFRKKQIISRIPLLGPVTTRES